MSKFKSVITVAVKSAWLRRAIISLVIVVLSAVAEYAQTVATGDKFNWAAIGGAVLAVVVKWAHSQLSDAVTAAESDSEVQTTIASVDTAGIAAAVQKVVTQIQADAAPKVVPPTDGSGTPTSYRK